MPGRNKKALQGSYPDSALSASGIQSKAVSEDTKNVSQERRVFLAFLGRPKTMLMVAEAVNVRRANICRFVADWKKHGKIQLVKFELCQVSNFRAGFYTTDFEFTDPDQNQE